MKEEKEIDENGYDPTTCGSCEFCGTLDCPYIGSVNELTHYEFIPCYAYVKYN